MDGVARRMTIGLAAVLVAALLGGQALADRMTPVDARASTGELVGRTGFAYLTGVRTYVAAVLWARLDPINDTYYKGIGLGKKTFLLPSIRMVAALDPTFQEAYYDGPFILYDAGLKANARQLAADGVRLNPHSAWLRASYAQLLLAEGELAPAAIQADLAMAGNGTWPSLRDEYTMLPPLEVIYNRTGQPAKARAVAALRWRIFAQLGSNGSAAATGSAAPTASPKP